MFSIITGLFFLSFTFANVIEAPPVLIDYEQNPSSMIWKKIDSEHFEIIFSSEIEAEAQRVTHLLEAAYPLVSRSLEVLPEKISLILQNQSTVSNGFVTLAPRRSEWYVTPPTNPELTNTEWLKTLAVHEFRHVVQFQKTRQGFNRVFEVFLGEIGQALGLGLTLPPWFLEGDAVGIETALTSGGRGRLPLFERDLKALLLDGRDYDYDKAHLGSFNYYIPSHYLYGYFYTSFLRNKHGDLFLSKIADYASDRSYNPLTFYNTYERLTGIEFEEFYRSTIRELINAWKEKESELTLTPYKVKNIAQTQDWTNYLYPQPLGAKTFLSLKKGLSHIPQFVISDGVKEKTILYPGPLYHEYPYKVRNGRFAFAEGEIDPRWGYRNFSRIRIWDLKEEKIIADFRKTKGRLAVLDFTGEFVLYVNWNENQLQQIIVRNLAGKEVYRLNYPKERVITSLDWLSHNEVVMVVKNSKNQKEVVKLSLITQEENSLFLPSTTNLGHITTYEGKILVESPTSGIDNIFEVKDGALIQITSSRFGAYAPAIRGETLVYNDYSPRGMNVVSKNLSWHEEQQSSDSFVPYFEKFAASEGKGEMEKDFFNQPNYPVKEYSQVKNAINFHSWMLMAPPLSTSVSVMGMSRDLMNKFSLGAGAGYDLNEQVTNAFVAAAWSHYYPVFDLRAGYGGRKQEIKINGKKIDDQWEEGAIEAGVQLPWKKIYGRFTQDFTLRSFAKVIRVINKLGSDITEIKHGALFSPGGEVQFSLVSRMAQRDLNPELGLVILAHHEEGRDITGEDQKGSLFTADSRLFLPGIIKHHSFYHQLSYEKQRDDFYQYSSLVLKPRGTKNVFLAEATKYSGNYLFPLAYPDWHMSRYLYFKRISMNLFYDEMNGHHRSFKYNASSTGWELMFDTHFFRIFVPFTLGVRGSYVLRGEEKKNNYEFFITTLGGYF